MGKRTYSFLGLKFDVDAAIEMAADREVLQAHPSDFKGFIPESSDGEFSTEINGLNPIDEAYAASTPNKDPIIFATCCYDNSAKFSLLIDGSHRLFKALYLDEADAIDYVILSVDDSLKLASGPLTQHMESYLKKHAA